jgi:type II secretory pathway component PulF
MNLKTVAAFCRRMGVGLRSGIDILRLLDMETKLGTNQHRQSLAKVHDSIREGNTFARALLSQKKYFPPLLIQMVNAAEIGGRLDSMFTYMADYYDGLLQTRNYFLSRISWPLIQLGLAILIIGGVILLQGIISPGGTPKFNASGTGLAGISGFVTYCIIVTTVCGTIGIFVFGIWKNWFNCHRILMPIVQRIPQLGTALTTLGLARLSMTLSMLLNAGVDAKRSLKQAFLATGNYYFIGGMDRALGEVEKGNDFGDAFQASEVLPQDFIDAVRVGELSGTETESFDRLAIQYQERAKAALGVIAMIASVVIWLCVMLLLAFMIISMAMKIFGVYDSLLKDLKM